MRIPEARPELRDILKRLTLDDVANGFLAIGLGMIVAWILFLGWKFL